MKTLAYLAEKFEKLLDRLPGSIRKLVEREWRPLNEVFIQRRPARLLIAGSKPESFFRELFGVHQGRIEATDSPWRTFHHRGALRFAIAGELIHAAKNAISIAPPDLFLFVAGDENKGSEVELLAELYRFDRERYGTPVPIVAVGGQTMELLDALHADPSLSASVAAVLAEGDRGPILTAIANALPQQARLEFARVSGEKAVQREIANSLTRSISGVCGAIGAQPIPLADFPILTSLQVLLVAGIVHVSGRSLNLETARDFMGALGANIGLGLAFRETARAAVKLLPGWGNAISGGIAAAGTYAVGRAATGYFVENLTLPEVRRRFRLKGRKGREGRES